LGKTISLSTACGIQHVPLKWVTS